MREHAVLTIIAVLFGTVFAQNPFLPEELQGRIRSSFEPSAWPNSELWPGSVLENVLPPVWKKILNSDDQSTVLERIETVLVSARNNEDTEVCLQDVTQLIQELSKITNLESPPATWALHMVDAWGKVPSGILSGNFIEPGDFLECINLHGEYESETLNDTVEVKGKYCQSYFLPNVAALGGSSTSDHQTRAVSVPELYAAASAGIAVPGIGICYPSSCSQGDIQLILNEFYNSTGDYLTQLVSTCTTAEKPPFDTGDYAMIIFLSVIASICIIATIVDVLLEQRAGDSSLSVAKPVGTPVQMLLAFSVYTNTRKWLSTKTGSDNLGCLHGLRFLSMSWVVLCHTAGMLGYQAYANIFEILEWYKDWSLFPILNGTLSVDTFFCMSGALMAYNLLRELDKTNGKLNYPLLVLHRYLRLTPTYMILLGIMATLLPYVANGPNWYQMDIMSESCAHNWWHNMLYINNLVDYTGKEFGTCYGEAWYLANDMQFFLLAPLVIYPLWRWDIIGYGMLAALSFISVVSPAYIMDAKQLPPTIMMFSPIKTYMEDIYFKPWSRCGPYIVGIVLGYVLYLRKKNPTRFQKIPTMLILAGWLLSTALALSIIYGPIPLFYPENEEMAYSAWYSLVYGGVHRYVWGMVIAWIIFACVNGNGGLINEFLSWKLFIPLGRLTFCMYISSYHLQMIYHMSQGLHPVSTTSYTLVYWFFGHLITAGFFGFVFMITLESPFIQLEKLIFSPLKSTNPQASAKGYVQRPLNDGNEVDTTAEITVNISDISMSSVEAEKVDRNHKST